MGLGNFRVRLIAGIVIVLVVWQTARVWSPITEELPDVKELQVKGNRQSRDNEVHSKVQQQVVLISVYYEALCPDSRSFVIKQLEPTYQSLKENIQIQMIPYGKATTTETDNGYEFTCQHGPIECDANMIHACAIDIIKEPSVQLDFLACMIKNNLNPTNITKVCAERMRLDAEPILNCFKDSRGKELLAMYGKMTDALRPQVSFIPTVTLDKNSDNQPAILKNLLEQVCLHFKVLPEGCK